eukprot:56709-Rhodomonas_salina.2
MRLVLLGVPLKIRAMQQEWRAGKALGERVRDIERPCTLHQGQDIVTHEVANEIPAYVDVTRELSVHGVVRDGNARRVVLPHDRGLRLLVSKSSQHCTEGASVASPPLVLCARARADPQDP